MKFLAISGSLRARSYSTALLRELSRMATNGATITIDSIDTLPVYSEDIEAQNFPARVHELRAAIKLADGVILAVPENNRTPSAAMKNFLDWSSRPESEASPWVGKPVAVFGASSGPRGASFAQYDVRRILGYFNASVMNQPEVYIGTVQEKFDEALELTDEQTRERLLKFLNSFCAFVARKEV